jgi:hypothetical protein
MSDAPHDSAIPDADKKMADQLLMISAIVAGVFAVLFLVRLSLFYLIVFGGIAAAIWFLGVMKIREGELQAAKLVGLVGGVVFGLLGLLLVTSGGFASIMGLVALGTAGALVYSAILLSPGRRLF